MKIILDLLVALQQLYANVQILTLLRRNIIFTKKYNNRGTLHTHTHTHPFNGPFSGTTQVSQYQKGKTNLDFIEAIDSEWQWHQLGHMQVCTLLQTDNHASTPPLLQAGCHSCRPTNSVKALKGHITVAIIITARARHDYQHEVAAVRHTLRSRRESCRRQFPSTNYPCSADHRRSHCTPATNRNLRKPSFNNSIARCKQGRLA